jgi:hypothetical protein
MLTSSITGWVAAVCIIFFSIFSLVVSWYQLSIQKVAFNIPLVSFLCFVTVRLMKGISPVTFNANLKSTSKQFSWLNSNENRFVLVAMPINHFGEKVRWCLDLINAPYDEITVGGLLSIPFRARTVPYLFDNQSNSIIGNSDEILLYMNAIFTPQLELLLANNLSKNDVNYLRLLKIKQLFLRNATTMEWEKNLNVFGHAVQGWAYYYHLGFYAKSTSVLLAWGAYEPVVSAIERWSIFLLFPVFKMLVRDAFKLNDPKKCAERYAVIQSVLTKVDEALIFQRGELNKNANSANQHVVNFSENEVFLMGSHISYIDIIFCSLAAPLLARSIPFVGADQASSLYAGGRFKSFKLSVEKREKLFCEAPSELLAIEDEMLSRPCGQYVLRMYTRYRKAKF